jgi:uncharacterized membrane protein
VASRHLAPPPGPVPVAQPAGLALRLVWLYVVEAVVRGVTDSGLSRALALGELVLCLALFAACIIVVRSRPRDASRQSAT